MARITKKEMKEKLRIHLSVSAGFAEEYRLQGDKAKAKYYGHCARETTYIAFILGLMDVDESEGIKVDAIMKARHEYAIRKASKKVKEALKTVMDLVNVGDHAAYEEALDHYDGVVEQAVETGMSMIDVEAIEAETGFIA